MSAALVFKKEEPGVVPAASRPLRPAPLGKLFTRVIGCCKTFERRQQADYLAGTGFDRDEATELLTETEVFVQAAEAWLK